MKRLTKFNRTTLAVGSLVMAAIILLSVNVLASAALRNVKADLTEQDLFTISDGTRQIVKEIDEPIDLKLYYSKRLGEIAPSYAKYFDRVKALLAQYRDLSGGKVRVTYLDPEPFSVTEDRAVAAGLQGVRLTAEGDTGYFGLVASNSTDNQGEIKFFSPDRERFLEYDLTKLIYTLAHPTKPAIGLITGLGIDGGMTPQGQRLPPWQIMGQIREFFEVHRLDMDLKEVPDLVGTLMIVHPDRMTKEAAYAVDQFALKGGRVLAFVDPAPEMGQPDALVAGKKETDEFQKLLQAWGVGYDPKKVAGDLAHARRVQFGMGDRPVVTDYVAWLALGGRSVDERDPLSGGIEQLNIASAGILEKREGATTTLLPILRTSNQSMAMDATAVRFGRDPVKLLRDFKPSGKPLTLAARISGDAKTAFPDGPPKAVESDKPAPKEADKQEAKPEDDKSKAEAEKAKAKPKPQIREGRINVIVVADTDMLNDRLWLDVNEFFGRQVLVPQAQNATFVVNALDNLAGNSSLLALRGRGVENRPFELVDTLRKDAERRYREKEQALVARLRQLQKQLATAEHKSAGSDAILTDKDKQALETFRRDLIDTRRQLRAVKHALREDIDRLHAVVKAANIGGIPILIALGGLAVAIGRRRRRRAD